MKLDKAIEILTDCLNIGTQEATPDVNNALKLGIEALKRIKHLRPNYAYAKATRLPGETK